MKYYISFSGGIGSAVSAIIAMENNLDFELLFADTLIEDEDLYRFNDDIAKAVGKEIITLTDGRTPWDVYEDKKWIGNTRTAHCSNELKTKQVEKWLNENASGDYCLVLGMDWSEIDRIERAKKRWRNTEVKSLLNEFKVFRHDYETYLSKYGIEKPRLYRYGFEHNNCGGFCCRAGLKQFERLNKVFPERYDFHAKRMDVAMKKIGDTAKPFLRMAINGETKYLTLIEYKNEFLSKSEDQADLFDFIDNYNQSGCGCFTDD